MTRPSPAGDSPELVAFGEAMIAFVAHPSGPLHEARQFSAHVAGAESNVAVGVARLGHRVSFAGRVGDDAFGSMIVRRLLAEGVATEHLVRDSEAPTGLLFRILREFPPPEVVYRRNGSAGSRLAPDDVRAALEGLPPETIVHVSGVTPALSESCRAAARVLAETARARSARTPESRCERVDCHSQPARGSIAHGGRRPSRCGRRPHRPWASRRKIRDNTCGAVASTSSHQAPIVVPSQTARRVVDAVGAGDAFNAGLVASLLKNQSLQ